MSEYRTILKWAQIAINDKENMEAVLIGIERIAKLLVRCTVYEELYIRSKSKPFNHSSLQDNLLELYSGVLEFLSYTRRHLNQNSGSKLPCHNRWLSLLTLLQRG